METGYDYFGARYYDSRIGRWLQVDPLVDKYPGINPYNYTLNNPLKFIDPKGMETDKASAAQDPDKKEKEHRSSTFPSFNPFNTEMTMFSAIENNIIHKTLNIAADANISIGKVADGVSAWAYATAAICVIASPVMGCASLTVVPELLATGFVADGVSYASKQIDASFNGGSQEKATYQGINVALDIFRGQVIKGVASKVAVRTGFKTGAMFRGSNGRFISNNFGKFVETARDALNVSSSIISSQFLKK